MRQIRDVPQTAEEWNKSIADAIDAPNPTLSNLRITRVHYRLSCALQDAIGPAAGPNFHSWAVWGSRKPVSPSVRKTRIRLREMPRWSPESLARSLA